MPSCRRAEAETVVMNGFTAVEVENVLNSFPVVPISLCFSGDEDTVSNLTDGWPTPQAPGRFQIPARAIRCIVALEMRDKPSKSRGYAVYLCFVISLHRVFSSAGSGRCQANDALAIRMCAWLMVLHAPPCVMALSYLLSHSCLVLISPRSARCLHRRLDLDVPRRVPLRDAFRSRKLMVTIVVMGVIALTGAVLVRGSKEFGRTEESWSHDPPGTHDRHDRHDRHAAARDPSRADSK